MNALELNNIGHSYFGRTVIDQVNISINNNEVVALVGPSGCGKSTLIHIAAGLVTPSKGTANRNYQKHAMVFQEPRLMPWATAYENIRYPLRLAGVARKDHKDRVIQAANAAAFELSDLDKYPVELSGGMRQRVAIARALSIQPDFIYFDEPFTALDVVLKRRMQDLVIDATQNSGLASLFVTHDLSEASRIAHRIIVLSANGMGTMGERKLPGTPGSRSDNEIFDLVQSFLKDDPVFKYVNDTDEHRIMA